MTIRVKVGEAKPHLSELLARVEAGEEVTISRGNDAFARLTRIHRRSDVERQSRRSGPPAAARAPNMSRSLVPPSG